jgi:hypothetical protein
VPPALKSQFYGFKTSQLVPYPGKVTVMREAGVTFAATGPVLALVAASIVSKLAELKLPSPDTSTTTVRGEPLPLLSVGEATARSSTITTTDPSAFSVARVSTVVVSVADNSSIFGPGELGVEGYRLVSV